MPVIFINGVPISNSGRYGLDSYESPQRHIRDCADIQDVEYEEIEPAKPQKNRKNDNRLSKESMDEA